MGKGANDDYVYELYIIIIGDSTSRLDGCLYAGQHKKKREEKSSGYFGSGLVVKSYIKKHGYDNVIKVIVNEVDTKEEADYEEIGLINDLRARYGCKCINIADGGHIPTVRKGAQIVKTSNRVIKELYLAGNSLATIHDLTGYSINTIKRRLDGMGIKRRSPTFGLGRRRDPVTGKFNSNRTKEA